MVIIKKDIKIYITITFAVWSSAIVLFNLPGVGAVYPLRIILAVYAPYLVITNLKNHYIGSETGKNGWLFIFWAYMVIVTMINKKWDTTSLYVISFTTIVLLLSLITRMIITEDDRLVALKAIVLNTVILYVLAVYENRMNTWIFHDSLPTKYNVNSMGTLTPVLFFGNTNNLCMFVCLALPCAFLVFKKSYIRLVFLMMTLHLSILTSCRTGIAIVFIFMAIIISVRLLKNVRLKFLTYFIAIFLGGFIILNKNIEINIRIYFWLNALYNSVRTYFLGTGAGSAQFVNSEHVLFSIIKSGAYGGYVVGAVHNYFLELLLEVGAIGVLTVIAWVKGTVAKVWKNRTEIDGLYYFCMLLIFLIASVCQSTLTQWFQAWIILGLLVSYGNDQSSALQ